MTHVDYFLQDFISTSDYVSLFGNFGNVSLDFFLDTHASALLFFFFFFWLSWVFIAAHRLSLVAVSRVYYSLQCMGFSLQAQ